MTYKPIAVISSNLQATMRWIQETQDIVSFNWAQKAFTDRHNNIFVIINNEEQALSWEFSGMIVAPDYYHLEHVVKTRIR